jgi:DNA-binding response OmpR family regulator
MAGPRDASPIRVALIDDDSGLVTVLDRRFAALRWDREVLSYGPGPDQLAAMRLHALIVNPVLTGLDYLERTSIALPGLALLVCTTPAPVAERVRGLRCGADDWVTKPCHPEELVARLQAIMRRRRAGELPADEDPVLAGELAIRPDRFDAYTGDEPAGLSRKEYELLRQLATAGGRVLEREDIYQRVWGYTMVRGDRSVDVFVRKLRQKLERVSPRWRYVHTHFGVGYRFAAEPVDPSADEDLRLPAVGDHEDRDHERQGDERSGSAESVYATGVADPDRGDDEGDRHRDRERERSRPDELAPVVSFVLP